MVWFVFLSEYLMYFRAMFLHTHGKHLKTLVFSYFQWVYRKAGSLAWSGLKSATEIHGFIKQN